MLKFLYNIDSAFLYTAGYQNLAKEAAKFIQSCWGYLSQGEGDEADGGGHEAGAEQDLGQGRRFHNWVFKL